MKKPYGYDFKLQFPGGAEDEEVSRVLSAMVACEDYSGPIVGQLLDDIATTTFDVNDFTNEVIKNMLRTLLVTGNMHVAYCFDCKKYVFGMNASETVCAYDTEGASDSHVVCRITIEERDERLFFGIWGDGYAQRDGEFPLTGNITMATIVSERGYSEPNIRAIGELEVGESHDCSDLNGVHVVVRIR